ncbi:MAG: D-aminoacylase [Candidatus Eremiobacteraeota bacterium]|nr:D-aminoacylase [Candidatus Eremiobacteraeota bacterium]
MLSVIFQEATIVDGTGRPRYTTDVGLQGERIALIGNLEGREAVTRVNCSGSILAPGFIDVHAHSDELWLALPRCDGKIAQGVTTEIGGNCGRSAAPLAGTALDEMAASSRRVGLQSQWRSFDDFFALIERAGVALNVASLVGLGTTRTAVADEEDRPLKADELRAQAELVRQACGEGAIGVSSGLIYPPSCYADLNELIAMACAAREAGAPLYASHIRNEGDTLLEAIEEALQVGERAEVAVQCSHHKAQGKRNWGKVHRSLELIERARARGQTVWADVYPYRASWTELATLLPERIRDGGASATVERLSDPDLATAVALEIRLNARCDWHDILITSAGSDRNESLAGMRIDEIARDWQLPAERAVLRLLIEEELDVDAIFFTMKEEDVAAVLSAEFVCIGSDASVRALEGVTARGCPHPRTFGTFPRIFGRFVRQRHTLTSDDAVRKMTSLAADAFGLRDRGRIEEGRYADIVIFKEDTICDRATYERPYQFPLGIDHVYVNGQAVLFNGEFTNVRPGRVLRHGGA